MTNLLEVKNLSFAYTEGHIILSGVSLSIDERSTLGIIGPNGGGKSTLLKILTGLLDKQQGELYWKGRLVSTPLYKIARISYVPQKDKLEITLPITVEDMVRFGCLPEACTKDELKSLLEELGLFNLKKMLVRELSGGQLQRVLLAKALISKPELIILDEPTKGLDSTGQDQFLSLIESAVKNKGASVILVDHNISQVMKHCDNILCLNRDHHWHDKKELFNKDVMDSIYHCEFEHTLIHEQHRGGKVPKHHKCNVHKEGHDCEEDE